MLKLRALNSEYSSDEDAPGIRKEAQEEIALDLYNKALRLQCKQNYNEAKEILYQLLNENIPLLESQGGLPKTMSTIKYSCYINIGTIAIKQQHDAEAFTNLLTASELDKTDVTLWYKIGKLALKMDKFRQAAFAFAQGLECSESHWPCLDQLISLLFGIQDTIACLQYIGKALMLDPCYIKGVILRKKIYEDNPATEEYYKQFNPDHIYEPDIKCEVSQEEEAEFLDDVRKLCDRINHVEKLLEPKPLDTIPLPRGLRDFTWVELGKTVTSLHQYLTDNNMTHLTKIDIKRCMSNDGTGVPVVEEIEQSECEMQVDEVINEDSKEPEKDLDVPVVQESEGENPMLVERRLSQNSENETENPASVVNENEDMEQENEEQPDQDEGSTQKTEVNNRSLTKSAKRKRDLVSELQIWGWHSKRKATKRTKTDKDYRIEDAFIRIIPLHLLPDGLPDNKRETFEDSRSPIDPLTTDDATTHEVDSYFGGDEESKDVKQFWSRNWINHDAIDLIEGFVYAIANLWNKKWPHELIDLYVMAYNMLREHASHPPLFNDDIGFELYKRDALCTLLFGELTTHTNNKKYLEEEVHCSSVSYLTMVSGWENQWAKDYIDFAIRVHWLRAHLFKKKNENNLAVMALQLIQDVINFGNVDVSTFKLIIPNNEKHWLINNSIIDSMLSKLELIDSLSRVEDLYAKEAYADVAEIIKLTFNSTNVKVTYGNIGRPAQLGMLMHSLWFTNQSDCFIWTEKCLFEALKHILKPASENDKWEMILEKCLLIMYELIKSETVSIVDILLDDKQNRLIETLTSLCRKQINTESTRIPMVNSLPYPWILLHYILLRDEHRQQAKKVVNHVAKDDRSTDPRLEDDEELPASIAILFSAHEFLGPKGWCLAKQGELLHFMLDSIIHRLDAPILEPHRDKIDIHLEQAFFCLYQHPCKKNKVSRHLADHNVNPLPLSWERAQQLYEYFCPEALPEFDSYKSISISLDLEQLLQRITAIIPKDCDPQPMLPKISEYIHATSSTLPTPIEFPARIKALYYLLGDYYFKQSEVKRSYKYFLLDLCINPTRIDTWAGLSLGIHSQLEYKLNHCERFKNEMEFLEKAKSAKICFQEALKLNNTHVTLWIEFGSFEYMVHAFCSRVLKYESEILSMEKFESLETEKESYLESSRNSFQRALELYQVDQGDADERWLFHYMIAKIAEKKQEDPKIYMQNYLQAASLLHENKCQYPEKINYNNPQHLSLEALEVHYRINASILKYLEAHDGKSIPAALGKLFKKCLDSSIIQKSKYETKANDKTDMGSKTDRNSDEQIARDVKKLIDDMMDKLEKGYSEKGSDSDDVVIIDSDRDEDKETSGNFGTPIIKVRNIHDMMENAIKECIDKETPMNTSFDSDVEQQSAVVTVANPVQEDLPCKSVEEKSEKDVRSEDEANIRKSTTTATEDSSSSSSSSSSTSSSDTESEDSSSVSSSTDSSTENMSEAEIINLVDRCIVGLEHCIRRLPQNYKALYRLAHAYYSYSKKKDLSKCKQLLMGEYKCKNSVLVTGLFSDRKTSNFFNGIWRIPSSEIDRPGSLSAHMSRCVTLLLQVLRDTNDHKTLFELCLQLRRIPDPDKVYIRHSEREQLSEVALTMCIQTLRKALKEIETMSPANAEKLLIDLFKSYQRSQKNLAHQEKVFSNMFIEAYKKRMGDKVIENSNILDMAIKYCQQTRVAEKIKKQHIPVMSPKPLVPTPPAPVIPPIVQPTPSNINILPIPPIKRPSFGRPRGRPPGPAKHPNQSRNPRGRSPLTNPFSWTNSLFSPTAQTSYDYFKHYQDELIRQYSQSQMSQFASLFGPSMGMSTSSSASTSASSLLNPSTTTTASSQLLNASLIQSMQQLQSGLNSATQLQNLSNLKPAMLKHTLEALGSQVSLPNPSSMLAGLSAEKLLQLAALGQQTSKPPKPTTLPKKVKSSTKISQPSTSSALSGQTSAFKYPTSEMKSKGIKTKTYSTSSTKDIPLAHSTASMINPGVEKQPKALMKDRPGISITPITPTKPPAGSPGLSNSAMPSTSASPGKTLQEKLADKQKQQKQAAKGLDFSSTAMTTPTTASSTTSAIPVMQYPLFPTPADFKNYQNVIPNYLLESGLSISQVQQKSTKSTSIPSTSQQSSTKSKQPIASSNLPITMSVMKNKSEKKTKAAVDDDVIIIE